MSVGTYFETSANTLLQANWSWAFVPGNAWVNNLLATVALPTSYVLGYSGGAFVFVMSVIGAFMNAGQTIYWVEDSIDDWLKSYGNGKYDDFVQDPDSEESS